MGSTKIKVIQKFPLYILNQEEVDVKARLKLNLPLRDEHYKTLAEDINRKFGEYKDGMIEEYKEYLFDKYRSEFDFDLIKKYL
jgi:hypothetical protein